MGRNGTEWGGSGGSGSGEAKACGEEFRKDASRLRRRWEYGEDQSLAVLRAAGGNDAVEARIGRRAAECAPHLVRFRIGKSRETLDGGWGSVLYDLG